jgi:hypothetical protein
VEHQHELKRGRRTPRRWQRAAPLWQERRASSSSLPRAASGPGRRRAQLEGPQIWKFDVLGNSVEPGFPPDGAPYGSTSYFPGVPAGLDAAVSHPNDGKSIYFFKQSEYWKYDMSVGAVVHGYPKPYGGSTGLWPGIPASVDAAMPHWNDGVSIFFFKGRLVYKYNIDSGASEQGYPRPYGTGTEDFQGVPPPAQSDRVSELWID